MAEQRSKGVWIALAVLVALGLVAAIAVVVAAGVVYWAGSRRATIASEGGTEMILRTDAAAREQVMEVQRQRLDSLDLDGTPLLTADAADGIVVQVPGTVDGDLLARALTERALLEFRAVSTAASTFDLATRAENWSAEQQAAGRAVTDADVDAWLAGQVGDDVEVLWSHTHDPMTGKRYRDQAHAVFPDVRVDGTMVREATVDFDQFSQPYVSLGFDDTGREAFCQLTDDVTGSPVAIVLDGEVLSAPVVQEPLCGGRARITMGTGAPEAILQDARLLAASLRAGALPADVVVESTRTLAPAG